METQHGEQDSGINSEDTTDIWFPSPEIYSPEISTEKWLELLKNPDIFSDYYLTMLKKFRDYGGEATCKELSNAYGDSANYYNAGSSSLAKRIWKATKCPLLPDDKNENSKWWPILYRGRKAEKGRSGSYVWKLRPELAAALNILFSADPVLQTTTTPRNLILYGPPGTGKTYSTVRYAVSIIEGRDVSTEPYDSLFSRYTRYKKEGRITSVTFHQSYGYEEFVEGIKPVIGDGENSVPTYTIEDGTFKAFCDRAKSANVLEIPARLLNTSPTVWKVSLYGAGENAVKTDCFENNRIRISFYESDNYGKIILDAFMNKMKEGDIVLSLYSNKEIDGIGIITGPATDIDDVETYRRSRPVHWIATNIRVNILPYNENKVLTTGTVYRLPSMKLDTVKEIVNHLRMVSSKPHVFIIDEINRGNISKIFGELITLIEPSKRLGSPEGTTVLLPYSGQEFGVPANISLIGTMNTADRSLALLDTALRRRFTFHEMLPDPDCLRTINIEGIDLANILTKMNQRIEVLYDREHTLGHAYFLSLETNPTLEHLAEIFSEKIVPLLQEYFYSDYEKIRLVLGDNQVDDTDPAAFIHRLRVDTHTLFGECVDDCAEYHYRINASAFLLPAAYQKITRPSE